MLFLGKIFSLFVDPWCSAYDPLSAGLILRDDILQGICDHTWCYGLTVGCSRKAP